MSPAKPAADPLDPKGLIRESFRIEGISMAECRSIFVDWALSLDASAPRPAIEALLARYGDQPGDHPMLAVLAEGLSDAPRATRRGGRAGRLGAD
jgi:hypothetical protein